jgi:hypothetical protein
MIANANSNISLLDTYLNENTKRNQKLDKAKTARLQGLAIAYDPLTDPSLEQQDTQTFINVNVEPKERQLVCPHCGNRWVYSGKQSKGFTLCKCRKAVRINPVQEREIADNKATTNNNIAVKTGLRFSVRSREYNIKRVSTYHKPGSLSQQQQKQKRETA